MRALLLPLFILILPTWLSAVGVDADSPESPNRAALMCGPNSLYVLALMSGHNEVDWSDLNKARITADGTSFLDLSQAAKQYGITTEVRKYDLSELDSIPNPSIFQLRSASGSLTPFHFAVFYKANQERLFFVDGTTGSSFTLRRDKLARFWTGNVLSLKEPWLVRFRQQLKRRIPLTLTLLDGLILVMTARWLFQRRSQNILRRADVFRASLTRPS